MLNYKSRKRRLPINDSSELSEVVQPEANLENDGEGEENSEINLVKFDQGVTNKGRQHLACRSDSDFVSLNFKKRIFEGIDI